tara:strand:+ start:5348 stop:5692 length:345 start_codon:yes stop_codon:yes gene_type:complete
MNGADAGDITTAVSGTYNDVTGVLDVTVNVMDTKDNDGTLNLRGFMIFDSNGWLSTPGPGGIGPGPRGTILAADFEPDSVLSLTDTQFLFVNNSHTLCCASANGNSVPGNAPNS